MSCIGVLSYRERLLVIIEQACTILCNKIAGNEIRVKNEASMQLQLGAILKTIGQLYEFSPADHFQIELETPEDISETLKSKKGARCDIKLAFFEGRQSTAKAKAFIELKFFKKAKDSSSSETFTDNRLSVLMDLENLEHYQDELKDPNAPKPLCYEIVLAQNKSYCYPTCDVKYNIGEGESFHEYHMEKKERVIRLKHTYTFHWAQYGEEHYWLILSI